MHCLTFSFRIWVEPSIWCVGADEFRDRVCPDSRESFGIAVNRILTEARLKADKTNKEYYYRFFHPFVGQIWNEFSEKVMKWKAIEERCQNWREEFDKDFKVCFTIKNTVQFTEIGTIFSFGCNSWFSHLLICILGKMQDYIIRKL